MSLASTVLFVVLAILAALVIDSYVGVSQWLKSVAA